MGTAIDRVLGVVIVLAAAGVIATGCGDGGSSGGVVLEPQGMLPETTEDLSPTGDASPLMLQGGTKGNGGDAVVCFKNLQTRDSVQARLQSNRHERIKVNPFKSLDVMNEVSSIEILDLFQYRLPSGFPPVERKFFAVSGRFDQALPQLMDRLKSVSGLVHKLEATLAEIPLQSWRQAEAVVEIDDSAEVFFLPPECLLVQVAVRQDNQVFYDAYLWNRMDELNRLGLVVHELVYKIGADRSQSTSEKARQIVGLIMSESELLQLSGFALYDRFRSLGDFSFHHQVGASRIEVSKVISEHLNGLPKEVASPEETEIKIGTDRWRVGSSRGSFNLELSDAGLVSSLRGYCPACSWTDLRSTVRASFAGDRLMVVQIESDTRLQLELKEKLWTEISRVEFDSFGQLMKVLGKTSFESNLGHVEVQGAVMVDADGNVQQATAGKLIMNLEYEGDAMVFDARQNLIEFRNVHQAGQCTDSRFRHHDISVRICHSDLIFAPGGQLRSVRFDETDLVKLGQLKWSTETRTNNDVYGLAELEISEDGETIRARTNKRGFYAYSESGQFHRVELKNKTVELKAGQLSVLP
jgi:hypothetical protein